MGLRRSPSTGSDRESAAGSSLALRSALTGAVLALSVACGGGTPAVSRQLDELEGLAFVPPGRCVLLGYEAPFNVFWVEEPLLVDRFEATLGDWWHYFGRGASEPDEPETFPVSLTLPEAERLAEARGMRLLRAHEWIYCAAGPRGHPFPWGPSPRSSLANSLELRLDRPASVGTFENGAGPFGCYDLFGNVWEWVADRVPGRSEARGDGEGLVSVLGGSYRYRVVPLYSLPRRGESRVPVFNALSVDPTTKSRDIGARFGAEARTYLWREASRWGSDEEARRRLLAIGARFGADAVPLLTELVERPEAPSGLAWLLEGASR